MKRAPAGRLELTLKNGKIEVWALNENTLKHVSDASKVGIIKIVLLTVKGDKVVSRRELPMQDIETFVKYAR
jgi:hypothetical protein